MAALQRSALSSLRNPAFRSAFLRQQSQALRQPLLRRHITVKADADILAKQRLNRPISPHLSIYQPQITWYGSMTHRLTGLILSGTFYLYFITYLVGPYIGVHIESLALSQKLKNVNTYVKTAVKGFIGWTLSYHSINGLRHLTWDVGAMLSNTAVTRSGFLVTGLSVLSAIWLASY
jgi:succinate dehydrogenase (ubiquinone) cytochrome b560 subunit